MFQFSIPGGSTETPVNTGVYNETLEKSEQKMNRIVNN